MIKVKYSLIMLSSRVYLKFNNLYNKRKISFDKLKFVIANKFRGKLDYVYVIILREAR